LLFVWYRLLVLASSPFGTDTAVDKIYLPPSPELWTRLRAFDAYCDLSLTRQEHFHQQTGKCPREWMVTIRPRRIPEVKTWTHSEGRHDTLAEAIRLAVEHAEPRGWTRGVHFGPC